MLCLGNICRSPYAGLALERALHGAGLRDAAVESAGFILPGRPSPPAAIAAARRAGLDLSGHRSRVVGPEAVERAACVLVMEAGQRAALRRTIGTATATPVIVLGDMDPAPIDRRSIPDPIDRPEEVFQATYERIDRCVAEVARTVASAVE